MTFQKYLMDYEEFLQMKIQQKKLQTLYPRSQECPLQSIIINLALFFIISEDFLHCLFLCLLLRFIFIKNVMGGSQFVQITLIFAYYFVDYTYTPIILKIIVLLCNLPN